jgi:hypothetical protein
VVRYISGFASWQLSNSTASLALAGEPILEEDTVTQYCAPSTVPQGISVIHPIPSSEGWLLTLSLLSEAGSAFCHALVTQQGIMFSIYGIQFCWGGEWTCPQAALDYMIPWRAGGVWHSPVSVADSFTQSWVQAGMVYVGCVHMMWVQWVTESSSVWSIVFCFFQGKLKEKKERKKERHGKWLSLRQTGSCAGPMQIKAVLRVSHWILCAPYVLAII